MVKYSLKKLVKDRRLTVNERLSGRLGYMGTAFIMIGPYILNYGNLGAISYIIGGILCTPHLVAVNVNVIIGYIIYLITST